MSVKVSVLSCFHNRKVERKKKKEKKSQKKQKQKKKTHKKHTFTGVLDFDL